MSTIRHATTVRVRYADTDKMGVVYNGNFLMYFEIGRTELLRSVGLPYIELEREGFLLPVREAHVEYKVPAKYDDLLRIETSYTHDPTSAVITLSYRIVRDETEIAVGYTRHGFVHAETWRPTRPPRSFVEAVTHPLVTSTERNPA
jgi:acyl-CoA thioester hydrolase